MIIDTIEIEIKYITLKKAFITALRQVENVEFVRVTICSSAGKYGIGEAPATKAITGEDILSIFSSMESIKEKLIGLEITKALQILHKSALGSSAKAALDMAIFFLLGKFRLENKEQIKTDITISLNEEKMMLEDAKSACEAGMNILKVKLGSDMDHAINITKILAQELPEAKLLIDANQAWSIESSLKYIEAVKDLQLELIEQPVVADDLESLKKITHATEIPILADESVFTLRDVKKVMQRQSADMINIKLMKCGGVSKAIEILKYAREKNIVCMLGSMLEGPYSINAALYLAFNYRDVIKYVDLDSPLLYAEVCEELEFKFDGCTISYKENS